MYVLRAVRALTLIKKHYPAARLEFKDNSIVVPLDEDARPMPEEDSDEMESLGWECDAGRWIGSET